MTIPQSEEAEKAVLSSMMQAPKKVIPQVAEKISADYFFSSINRNVYKGIIDLWRLDNASGVTDLVGFSEYAFSHYGVPKSIATEIYTFNSIAYVGENLTPHLETLRDKYILRELAHAGDIITRAAYHNSGALSTLADAQKLVNEIGSNASWREAKSFRDSVAEKLERMENNEPSKDLLTTGLSKLDKLSPVRNGDMVLLQAERKTGKSILALNVALHTAKLNRAVLIFSLEDREPKLVDRLFSAESKLPNATYSANLSIEFIKTATDAVGRLMEMPITIRDDCYDLNSIIAVSRENKTRHNTALIVVDYAQLVRTDDREQNRERAVAGVSRGLRLLAMELDTPVLLLSQVNEMGRSRESRALEQDCTAVWHLTHEEDEGPAFRYLNVPAQRNGESGIRIPLTFRGEIARFENYAEDK